MISRGMNVRGYQHLPSAPPALSACIYCRTPVITPFRPLPCGCFLPLHTQCRDTLMISEVGCPACRTFWVAGIESSATSVTSVSRPWPSAAELSEVRPSHSCVRCECSPWWSVYVIGVLFVGIGVLYLLFHYVIE
jgi:hypothetical protein